MCAQKLAPLLTKVKVSRFFYKACGYTDEDLKRPIIGIVNSFNEACPGHIHLKMLADAVKAGVYAAGGTPIEINVIGPCAAYSRNYRYDLPTRDTIANSMEIQLMQSVCDGIVCMCTCDKIVPGMWLGAARLDLPTIFVTGGPSLPGEFKGEETCFPLDALVPIISDYAKGLISEEELWREIGVAEETWIRTYGACPEMTTANTVQMLTEAMGLAFPYSTTTPAPYSLKLRLARRSGMCIVEAARKRLSFRKIVTEKSLENALRVLCAVGGGTNGALHVFALAYELGLSDKINPDRLDEISRSTPFLSAIRPSGPFTVVDFHEAGGVPGVMRELGDLIHRDALTVTGETIGAIIESASIKRRDVIRSRSDPVYPEGAFAVLKGNIAPRGAICRYTAVKKELLQFEGEANVCNSLEEAVIKVVTGKVEAGQVLVVRYEGPRGGPGMTEIVIVLFLLRMLGIENIAVVTDGRYSGTAEKVLYIGHVCPEAAVGGPIAVVEDGDVIEIDVPARKINVKLPDKEIERRLKEWTRPKPRVRRGVLAIWAQLAEQADVGAVLRSKI
ncbi:MAG: dihydroxy-acid dehydratase [Candidatus Baldrarchaeia archaeon]